MWLMYFWDDKYVKKQVIEVVGRELHDKETT